MLVKNGFTLLEKGEWGPGVLVMDFSGFTPVPTCRVWKYSLGFPTIQIYCSPRYCIYLTGLLLHVRLLTMRNLGKPINGTFRAPFVSIEKVLKIV